MPASWIEMRVAAVAVDEGGAPAAMLESEDGRRLAIRIGVAEAPTIAAAVDGVQLERPCTFDLMRAVIDSLEGAVDHVEISGGDGLPTAAIALRQNGGDPRRVDARPSDAIALALRAAAPIRVARSLTASAAAAPGSNGGESPRWKR